MGAPWLRGLSRAAGAVLSSPVVQRYGIQALRAVSGIVPIPSASLVGNYLAGSLEERLAGSRGPSVADAAGAALTYAFGSRAGVDVELPQQPPPGTWAVESVEEPNGEYEY